MKPKNIKHLIVAAYHRELSPLCAMNHSHLRFKGDSAYLAAGIGPVAAAFGLTHFLEDYRPQCIIALGTAGTFDSVKAPVGSVVLAKSVSIASGLASLYTVGPKSSIRLSRPTGQYAKYLQKFNRVSVYAPQEITKCDGLATELSSSHDVENLELMAFAFVAQKFKLPLISILGITNSVGRLGHEQWCQNEKSVLKSLAMTIKALNGETPNS